MIRKNKIKNIKIKKAKEKDIPEIQNVIYESLKSVKEKKALIKKLFNDYSILNIKKARKRTDMFIAKKNKKILGTGRIEGTHEIRMIYVKPKMQKKGIGTKMINYLEKIAKEKKWKSVHVKALWSAKEFYEKLGFVQDKKKKNKETCFMRKKLE